MKITLDNIKDINYIYNYNLERGKNLLESLLIDIKELNDLLIEQNNDYKQIYINYEDKHNEYSPERVEPCPDYYGMFSLRFEEKQDEHIGEIMDLVQLDESIYLLINFVEFKK